MGPVGGAEVRKDVALAGQDGILSQNAVNELWAAIDAAEKQKR